MERIFRQQAGSKWHSVYFHQELKVVFSFYVKCGINLSNYFYITLAFQSSNQVKKPEAAIL